MRRANKRKGRTVPHDVAQTEADVPVTAAIRVFETGASRDTDEGKLDYEAALSPEVLRAFAIFMEFNRHMKDGSVRDADNWQKGMPLDTFMKSGSRHFMDWWLAHRECQTSDGRVWSILGLMFNAMGYLHEFMKAHPSALPLALSAAHARREDVKQLEKR
jgi:hypothetical protein